MTTNDASRDGLYGPVTASGGADGARDAGAAPSAADGRTADLAAYALHLTIHGDTVTRDVPAATAAEVHRHARGWLGSQRVDVHLDEATLTGTIHQHGATVGEFTLEPATAQEPPTAPLHGYTIDDIHHLAQLAVRIDRWRAGDVAERLAAVRCAIVEHLLTATEPPTRRGLVDVGTRAADALIYDDMRTHGKSVHHMDRPMPRWHAYWNPSHTASPEDKVIDRCALEQIWPRLQHRHRQAIEALAATGDHEQAAVAIGLSAPSYKAALAAARRAFLALWHEGETPSRIWRASRAVHTRTGRTHDGRRRLTVSQVEAYRERHYAGETLAALAAEAGFSRMTISNLLNGRSKPAPDFVEVAA